MARPAILVFADFVASAPKHAHSAKTIQRAKLAFLDTLGCMVLGSQTDVARTALTAAGGFGAGLAPVIGMDGARLPAPWAAMVNGAAAHALDFDDFTMQANDHASAVLAPAVLAAASQAPDMVSGADLLDAYLIGLEVIYRIGEAVNMAHYNLGWHTTSTLDGFGATAAVSRLWGLSAPETAAALSLTTSMGSGYVSQFGTSAKPLHAGFSAKTGIVAASLGKAGASAYSGALDGPVSFSKLLMGGNEARFGETLVKLGKPWGIEEFGLAAKLYPSCGYIHSVIDCARALHNELEISSPGEIASATLSLPDFYVSILPFHVPATPAEALFSPAYCVALALTTGHNKIDGFSLDALKNRDLLSLTERISVEARAPKRPELNLDPEDPNTVEARLTDGRTSRVEIGVWSGLPGCELSENDFAQKFNDCLAEAAVEPAVAARVQNTIMDMDGATDVRALFESFSPAA